MGRLYVNIRMCIVWLFVSLLIFSLTSCTRNAFPETSAAYTETDQESFPSIAPQSTEEADAATVSEPKNEESSVSEASSPIFSPDDIPRLDGSTTTVPLAMAILQDVYGLGPNEAESLICFSKTTNAYMNLLYGKTDLLIVGESNETVQEEKDKLGFEWEKEVFALDAFVFLVNEENPVDSITIEEARKIYTGEITNWKELGGRDEEIVAFQRNQGAGSQTLMEKLVMQGEPMIEAPKEYLIGSMNSLIEAVKNYDNSSNAIGYTVYYYAEEMRMAQGLKLLFVEGVPPTNATIRAGAYPLISSKYVVMNKNEAEDSSTRKLFDYLLTEDGQKLIAGNGYVSVIEVEENAAEDSDHGETGKNPEEINVSGELPGELIPREGCGTLIPYIGRRDSNRWPYWTGCVYGLMTTDGKAVTAPCFSWVNTQGGKYLILTEAAADKNGRKQIFTAAAGGSWVSDKRYMHYSMCENGYTAFIDEEYRITVVDNEGRELGSRDLLEYMDKTEVDSLILDEQQFMLGQHAYLGEKRMNGVAVGYVVYDSKADCDVDMFVGSVQGLRAKCKDEEHEVVRRSSYYDGNCWYIYDDYIYDAPGIKAVEDTMAGCVTYYLQNSDVIVLNGRPSIDHLVELHNGVLGVITQKSAKYYNYETMELIVEFPFTYEPYYFFAPSEWDDITGGED